MEPMNKDAGELATEARRRRIRGKTTLLQRIQNAGGSSKFLAGGFPLLATGSPQDLSDAEVLAETIDCYEDSERRLGLCARCPSGGGACATDHSVVPIGEEPVWSERKLSSAPCPKWADFVVRRRLGNSGVPEYYFDSSFASFTRPLDPDEQQKLVTFGDAISSGGRAWLVVTGPRGRGKTRLAVALLRTIVRRSPRTLLWYSDVTSIRSVMRQRYDDPASAADPFENARACHVLVIDNVDPGRYAKEPWVRERIEALLRERWLRRRSTLVLTHESLEELAGAFSDITGLTEAALCNLR